MRALRPGRSLEPGRTTPRFLTLRPPSISYRCRGEPYIPALKGQVLRHHG
jgi:hypothetical protein